MDRNFALEELERQASTILEIASRSDAGSPVPSCPGWSLSDLVTHLGNVYNWAGTIVAERRLSPPARDELAIRPVGATEPEWMGDRLERLTAELATVPDGSVLWNFGPVSPAPAAFWWRRQLHETLVHRIDAELAAGREPARVDREVAADNIDEVLLIRHFVSVEPGGISPSESLTIHLHATDLEGAEWTIDTAGRRVAREHSKGDVAIRAPAFDLMRWMWGRTGVEQPGDPGRAVDYGELEVFGDLAAAERWRRTVVT